MARKGRPSKPGKRQPNGKRKTAVKTVDPTAKIATAKRRFGSHYASALGRFFASGLMGEIDVAKGRFDGAQRYLRIYRAVFGAPGYHCPLDQTPKGAGGHRDNPFAEQDREWMRSAMKALDASGCYPYLEQVLSINHVDAGPAWLDRMLDVQRWNAELAGLNTQVRDKAKREDAAFTPMERKTVDPRDKMIADAAIRALDILAPEPVRSRILVEFYTDAA
jgi:hypothetical protein